MTDNLTDTVNAISMARALSLALLAGAEIDRADGCFAQIWEGLATGLQCPDMTPADGVALLRELAEGAPGLERPTVTVKLVMVAIATLWAEMSIYGQLPALRQETVDLRFPSALEDLQRAADLFASNLLGDAPSEPTSHWKH